MPRPLLGPVRTVNRLANLENLGRQSFSEAVIRYGASERPMLVDCRRQGHESALIFVDGFRPTFGHLLHDPRFRKADAI
jgi:hypothetical protein